VATKTKSYSRPYRAKPAPSISGRPRSEPSSGPTNNLYAALSLRDLLDARDQYHVHLMRHPNVVATAIGYYRIRQDDTWPGVKPEHKGEGPRTLANSEVRPYSWPAVLVFVDKWVAAEEFGKGRDYDPDKMVPRTLYLPDGRRVPVCVIEAPRDPVSPSAPPSVRFPLNNIGSGHPVLVDVQQREHVATIACLATDGHKTYALTNRHVTGGAGEVLSSQLGGRPRPIGVASPLQLTRVAFSDVYPDWPGRSTFVNMDVGLIDIDDINAWTAKLQGNVTMGSMVDLSAVDFPLTLITRHVRGYGAASQWVLGEIHALFYRYKSRGGFEYVADFFIGPRTPTKAQPTSPEFVTRPGDSGTLWLLEPVSDEHDIVDAACAAGELRPLAMQWGANRLYSGLSRQPRAYALATCLSTVCDHLDVDLVRDWNLDQPDTWGAVGHFSIASRVTQALSNAVPTLARLMRNNAHIISHDDDTILNSKFKGLGDDAFIPMADVPDFFWKHGKQGHTRHFEGPNHFADMDQKRPSDGIDLLKLCENPANIDPDVWNDFYERVKDLLDGGPITPEHRGLLPFRVWQIFDEMVRFVKQDKMPEFVCAAGVLTHYIGDACQPLHISFLHDGDPLQATTHVVHHRDGTEGEKHVALGQGVHSAYEDKMVDAHRDLILGGLDRTPKVTAAERVANGREAAIKTVELMRQTFRRLPPQQILDAFVARDKNASVAEQLWTEFGDATIAAMQDGTHLLAVLWEQAWIAGGGEDRARDTSALEEGQAMDICAPAEFLRSVSVDAIGQILSRP
jgi:hypothetical protein